VTTVATPSKCPGRHSPSSSSVSDLRKEQQVAAGRDQAGAILLRRARIARVVLVRAELGRIDEAADHDARGMAPCDPDQREVALVQVAHGRHEGDALVAQAPGMQRSAQVGDVFDDLHQSYPCSVAGNSPLRTAAT
jgi:hypothetical protein